MMDVVMPAETLRDLVARFREDTRVLCATFHDEDVEECRKAMCVRRLSWIRSCEQYLEGQ